MYIRNHINRKVSIINPEISLYEAAKAFKRSHSDGLPVVNAEGRLVGLLTKTHLVNALVEVDFHQCKVQEVMDRDVFYLFGSTTVKEAQQKHEFYFHDLIPVVDDSCRPIGILNKADLMRCLSEEAAFLAEELLTVINSTRNGVIAINSAGIITLFNSAAESLIGIKARQAIGICIEEILPSSGLRRIVTTGMSESNKREIIGGRDVLTNRSPIRKNDTILGAVDVFQDITELQSVVAELETVKDLKSTLESVLESIFEGIVVVDKQGNITMLNQAYGDFLNIDPQSALGKPATEVIPNTRMHLVVKSRKAEIAEVQRIGNNNVVVTRVPIIKDGEITGAVGRVLFKDVKELSAMANKLNELQNELEYYKNEWRKNYSGKYSLDSIVSASAKMTGLKSTALKASKGNATVLIMGESGTGKELFAHAIHNASSRCSGPFIKVNCAAIPENLLEAELFGYEDGAFTGTKKGGKPGKFELANEGTIFLDEIGDMTLSMQAKVLRVLQEKEIDRLGGTRVSNIDVRVIAATNRDLEQMVNDGTFRLDLYYRLNIIALYIPPLRERQEDIPLLCEFLLKKINANLVAKVKGISPAVMKTFMDYRWPGNVRELENVLERAVNLMDEEEFIMLEHVPPSAKKAYRISEDQSADIYSVVENAERQAIYKALEAVEGNKSKAAQLLGLHRSAFYKRLKKYQIVAED